MARTGGGKQDDLHAAARSGDLIAVQTILSSNPLAVNSRDKHSRTPLHLAAWSGHAEVVNYLCKHKADVGAAAMDDMGAIHFAAQKGHLEVVRTLLSSGASIKAATRKGFTPLHYAAQGSHMELVKYLVKKGANVNAKTKAGKAPADLASNSEIVNFLEEREEQSRKGNLGGKQKVKESDPKPLSPDETKNSGDGAMDATGANDEGEKENVKRKDDGDETGKEASSRQKRAKVALHHLQSMDDTEEGEETL